MLAAAATTAAKWIAADKKDLIDLNPWPQSWNELHESLSLSSKAHSFCELWAWAPLFLKKCELELELSPHERKLTLVAPSSGQNWNLFAKLYKIFHRTRI
jgi:hypothetical protein